MAKNGYIINGDFFSNHVSFRPPFYSCVGCMPDQVSSSFKKSRYWYDDDLINVKGITKQFNTDDGNDNASTDDDQQSNDYFHDDVVSISNSTSLTDDLSNYFASFVDDTLASISSGSNATTNTADDGANETQDDARRMLLQEDNRRVLAADPSLVEVRLHIELLYCLHFIHSSFHIANPWLPFPD